MYGGTHRAREITVGPSSTRSAAITRDDHDKENDEDNPTDKKRNYLKSRIQRQEREEGALACLELLSSNRFNKQFIFFFWIKLRFNGCCLIKGIIAEF